MAVGTETFYRCLAVRCVRLIRRGILHDSPEVVMELLYDICPHLYQSLLSHPQVERVIFLYIIPKKKKLNVVGLTVD